MYIVLTAASLESRDIRRYMKGHEKLLKPYNDFYKIKQPKTNLCPMRSFILKENHIVSAVTEIHRYRQKKLTTL